MKKVLLISLAIAALASCSKHTPEEPVYVNTGIYNISINKETYGDATKAVSDSPDVQWEVGEQVTVLTETGSNLYFTVTECDGLNATISNKYFGLKKGTKYRFVYPHVYEAGQYIITTYGDYDWRNPTVMYSDWMEIESEGFQIPLKHIDALIDIDITLPRDGVPTVAYLANEAPLFLGKTYWNMSFDTPEMTDFLFSNWFCLPYDKGAYRSAGEILEVRAVIFPKDFSQLNTYLYLEYPDVRYRARLDLGNVECAKRYSFTVDDLAVTKVFIEEILDFGSSGK